MANISVCMIVKNEAALLARCLDSLQGLWNELIVVDTGSVDDTPEIAKRYAAQVYSFEWVDDFAAARNFSLSKASCDYVYVADADEVLDEENRRRFLQLKDALLPEVEVVEMAYANRHSFATTENFAVEYRPKLFRRLRPFQFADPIHEALRTDPVVYRSNVVVQHCPAADHSGRDLQHFARLVAGGQRFSSRLEMMYARELLAGGTLQDFNAAEPYFAAVRADAARSHDSLRRAACVLAQQAALRRNAEDLLRLAAPELVGTPPCEICCALGDYYLAVGQPETAADWFGAALSGAVPELVAAAAGRRPLLGMAACYEAAGDAESAAHYRRQAEAWDADALRGEM